MSVLEIGDRVRVDIPDVNDPDHDRLHESVGTVTGILEDDAGASTGDYRDSYLYIVELDALGEEHFRWRDLRPITSDE